MKYRKISLKSFVEVFWDDIILEIIETKRHISALEKLEEISNDQNLPDRWILANEKLNWLKAQTGDQWHVTMPVRFINHS